MAEPTPEFKTWYEQFKAEHGYAPEDDPDLKAKGMNPQDSIREHWKAHEWGKEFHQMTGRTPTYDDYRHGQPRRYSDTGELVSGFGGSPPETWEDKINRGGGGGSSSPDVLNPALRRGFTTNLISRAPTRRNNRNGF